MSKNTNKKAKFKPIIFEIQKNVFNKAIKNALKCTAGFTENNILTGINFKFDNEILTLASTDGNALIAQEINIDEVIAGGTYQLTLSGQHLYKASIKASYGLKRSLSPIDRLKITINEDGAIIEDILNRIQYTIPALGSDSYKFPDYKKLIPKDLDNEEKYTKVGFNTQFMARFADISNPKTRIGVLRLNKEKPLECMYITSKNESDGINTTALLMPIQL